MKNEDAYVLREGDAVKRFLLILFYTYPKPLHKFPGGRGATRSIASLDTGCTKRTRRACRQMLPSGLERGNPYIKSPLMGHPILAN